MPLLQQTEGRHALWIQCDELAVQDRRSPVQQVRQHAEIGKAGGGVVPCDPTGARNIKQRPRYGRAATSGRICWRRRGCAPPSGSLARPVALAAAAATELTCGRCAGRARRRWTG